MRARDIHAPPPRENKVEGGLATIELQIDRAPSNGLRYPHSALIYIGGWWRVTHSLHSLALPFTPLCGLTYELMSIIINEICPVT